MEKNNMPQDTLSFLQRISEYGLLGYAWLLVISFWAGTAKYLTSLNGKKPTFWGWFAETMVSGFVGVIAAMICQYYGLDFMLTAAITGISAHNGTRSLYLFGQIIKKNSGCLSEMIDPPSRQAALSRKGDDNDNRDSSES